MHRSHHLLTLAALLALTSCGLEQSAPVYYAPGSSYVQGSVPLPSDQQDISPPPPPSLPQPPPPTATGGYPTAERTANPDQVLSPYEPYNVIDVAGFPSGKLVRDPSNQKIFRVP